MTEQTQIPIRHMRYKLHTKRLTLIVGISDCDKHPEDELEGTGAQHAVAEGAEEEASD